MIVPVSPRLIRLRLCNPLRSSPWQCEPVTVAMVQTCLREGALRSAPCSVDDDAWIHAQRIAHLVVSGWEDHIAIDVGVPSMGTTPSWPVEDGNHRLFASFLRRDREIIAEIGGDIDYAIELLEISPEVADNSLATYGW